MSESADYWNRMMRANDMDSDAALAAIQGHEEEEGSCLGCGAWISKADQVTDVTCVECEAEEEGE